jgi:hypothetical protein
VPVGSLEDAGLLDALRDVVVVFVRQWRAQRSGYLPAERTRSARHYLSEPSVQA